MARVRTRTPGGRHGGGLTRSGAGKTGQARRHPESCGGAEHAEHRPAVREQQDRGTGRARSTATATFGDLGLRRHVSMTRFAVGWFLSLPDDIADDGPCHCRDDLRQCSCCGRGSRRGRSPNSARKPACMTGLLGMQRSAGPRPGRRGSPPGRWWWRRAGAWPRAVQVGQGRSPTSLRPAHRNFAAPGLDYDAASTLHAGCREPPSNNQSGPGAGDLRAGPGEVVQGAACAARCGLRRGARPLLRPARLERGGQDHGGEDPIHAAQGRHRDGPGHWLRRQDTVRRRPRIHQSTGQFAAVDEILTGRENLVLVARLRRLEEPVDRR